MRDISTFGTIDGLALIERLDSNLVIWQRTLSPDLQEWISQVDPETLPDFRILVKPHEVKPALKVLLDSCGLVASEIRHQWVEDISELGKVFSKIICSEDIDLRLSHITSDACWKFHKDFVEMRLITTYLGPSTQWVKPTNEQQAIQEQRDHKGPLEELNTGDVAIFKGRCSDGYEGIMHRSPLISGKGCHRLLLCLNKPSDTSPAAWVEKH